MEKAMDLAGSNKIELEKVIQCYSQKPEDSLKLQAAYFLIENMPYHYYYEGESLDSILIYYELLSENKNIKPQILLDSLEKIFHFSLKNLNKRYDIQTLDSVFICKNIEFSFKVWEEQPWGKNVSFDDFCKYILPYRIGTEKLVLWKEQFYNKYNSILKESGKFLKSIFVKSNADNHIELLKIEGEVIN